VHKTPKVGDDLVLEVNADKLHIFDGDSTNRL